MMYVCRDNKAHTQTVTCLAKYYSWVDAFRAHSFETNKETWKHNNGRHSIRPVILTAYLAHIKSRPASFRFIDTPLHWISSCLHHWLKGSTVFVWPTESLFFPICRIIGAVSDEIDRIQAKFNFTDLINYSTSLYYLKYVGNNNAESSNYQKIKIVVCNSSVFNNQKIKRLIKFSFLINSTMIIICFKICHIKSIILLIIYPITKL